MDVRIALTQNRYTAGDTKPNADSQTGDVFCNVLAQQTETEDATQKKSKQNNESDENLLIMSGMLNSLPIQLTDMEQLTLGDTVQTTSLTEHDQELFQNVTDITEMQMLNDGVSQIEMNAKYDVISSMFEAVSDPNIQLNVNQTKSESQSVTLDSLLAANSLMRQQLKTSSEFANDIQVEVEVASESQLETCLNVHNTINGLETMRTTFPKDYLNKDEVINREVTNFNLENNQDIETQIQVNQVVTDGAQSVQFIQNQEVKSETVTTVKWENQFETMDEIVQTAQTLNQDEVKTIVLRLYPRHLGNVNVVLSMKDGVLSAKMMLERADVKDMMEKSLQQLASTFERNHVKVQSFEVTVQTNAESFDNHNDEKQKRSKKEREEKVVQQSEESDNASFKSLKELISQWI
ncbi:MAG TPA: hypothetical protein DCY20_03385 [Firmicutes bacterium]|nr:hypothetical protein [Bacillota bacterium]